MFGRASLTCILCMAMWAAAAQARVLGEAPWAGHSTQPHIALSKGSVAQDLVPLTRRLLDTSDGCNPALFATTTLAGFFGGLLLGGVVTWAVIRRRAEASVQLKFPMWHGESCRTSRASKSRSFCVSRSIPVHLDPEMPLGLPVYDYVMPAPTKSERMSSSGCHPAAMYQGRISMGANCATRLASPDVSPLTTLDSPENSPSTTPDGSLNSLPKSPVLDECNMVVQEERAGWVVRRSPTLFHTPMFVRASNVLPAMMLPLPVRRSGTFTVRSARNSLQGDAGRRSTQQRKSTQGDAARRTSQQRVTQATGAEAVPVLPSALEHAGPSTPPATEM